MTPRARLALHALSVLLLSAYPLSLMLRSNLGIVPISLSAIALILVVYLAIVATLFVALRMITADIPARAAWLCVFLLMVGVYVAVTQQAGAFGWPVRPDDARVSVAYLALSIAMATLASKPWRSRQRDPVPMLLIGFILFATNTALGVSRLTPIAALAAGVPDRWQAAAAELIARSTAGQTPHQAPERDIYYIVLDGFGSSETLSRVYGVDGSGFERFLTQRGFAVVEHAASNYIQTYLSLASTLNLDYLDAFARAVGPASSDRFPLADLINRNALMVLAKRTGYHVVAIGSDYGPTERMSNVDRCLCDQHGSSTNVQALLAASPMLVHVLGPRFVDGHRRKVAEAFDLIERTESTGARLFVFAHIVAPHPPFVFDERGGRPDPMGSIWFQDGSAFGGTALEYRDGYGKQAQFVMRRLMAAIDHLLRRPGPSPVIVFHGDHGPGLRLNWERADQTDVAERTGIFAAYRLPGAGGAPYAGMTPINGARLIANEYLGTTFGRLEDRMFFSTWGRPYDLKRLGREAASGRHDTATNP